MDANLQQRGRWTFRQINDRLARVVPAARRFQPAHSTQVAMTADSPQDHLDEHAFINLN
jgi:hypothetical protein